MLEDKLRIMQEQLELKLQEIRSSHRHSGNKGSNVEQVIRDFLREFLPAYSCIGHGEVIDAEGNYSTQLDIIITNEFHPFLNDLTQPSIFFVEGTACAGEIKSILTSQGLDESLQNCVRFKNLNINFRDTMILSNNVADRSRFIEKRPFFLFAFESQLTLDTIIERVNIFNTEQTLPIIKQIDAVFILDQGCAVNFGDGSGAMAYRTEDGQFWGGLIKMQKRSVLFEFLAWLSIVTPKYLRFTSILLPYLYSGRMVKRGE